MNNKVVPALQSLTRRKTFSSGIKYFSLSHNRRPNETRNQNVTRPLSVRALLPLKPASSPRKPEALSRLASTMPSSLPRPRWAACAKASTFSRSRWNTKSGCMRAEKFPARSSAAKDARPPKQFYRASHGSSSTPAIPTRHAKRSTGHDVLALRRYG